jgi:DNA-binding winged helix-turn-helix (wHTH) protein
VEDTGALPKGGVFLFERFRWDRQARTLFRRNEAGDLVPIAIGSRALDVLDVLVGRAGKLVSRDELMAVVWRATAVEDSNLNMQIAALRRILGEGRAAGGFIQTHPGRGYRFVCKVAREDGDARRPLSIVVLPFTNLSGDREQQYFADGITDDVTTDLSRLADMFVISRNRRPPIGTARSIQNRSGASLGCAMCLKAAFSDPAIGFG